MKAPIFKAWLAKKDRKGLKVVEDLDGVRIVLDIQFSDGVTRTLVCDMSYGSYDTEHLDYAYFGKIATVTVTKYTEVKP